MKLSIIIPTLNEGHSIVAILQRLQPLREGGDEVIVVDGGSDDQTLGLAAPRVDHAVQTQPGRARQMNYGAALATNEILLFLHADTALPDGADQLINRELSPTKRVWGRFDLRLSGDHFMFRVIERMINLRSRLSGVATGDQAIFVKKAVFDLVGGYAEIPLMEDIALTKTLRTLSRGCCIRPPVVTSSRRWERHGIFKTIRLMWWLRLQYLLGRDPVRLADSYRYDK